MRLTEYSYSVTSHAPELKYEAPTFMLQSQRFGYPRDAQQLTVASICYHGNVFSASTLRSNGFIFPAVA
jgi:hypothetical protein